MKLQGPIPQNFSKLINLENLMLGDLEGNYTSFVFVENWANLSTLSLRKCGLTGQLLSPPRNLPKLKYLDLTSNNLSGSIKLLLQYKDSLNFIYVGNNSFSERLPPEIIQPSVPLDVSYNPFINGSLRSIPAGQKWPINYIGTSVDANGTINSGSLTILNCLRMQECNRNDLTSKFYKKKCFLIIEHANVYHWTASAHIHSITVNIMV
jgi:Leucine-rich repeat (LRR) protein